MNANRQFVMMMNRLTSLKYSTKDFPSANLQNALAPKEFADLRTELASATVLLLPIEFTVHSTPRAATGLAFYRAYSLGTGRLLLQKRFERRSAKGGDAGEREVTVALILDIQDDVAKHLVAP